MERISRTGAPDCLRSVGDSVGSSLFALDGRCERRILGNTTANHVVNEPLMARNFAVHKRILARSHLFEPRDSFEHFLLRDLQIAHIDLSLT
jgi:hypothetical protein